MVTRCSRALAALRMRRCISNVKGKNRPLPGMRNLALDSGIIGARIGTCLADIIGGNRRYVDESHVDFVYNQGVEYPWRGLWLHGIGTTLNAKK